MNESTAPPAPTSLALWDLPFRPFFLGGTLFAALSVPLWIAVLRGSTAAATLVPGALSPLVWHGHEMIFGYVLAIVVGFVGTASQTWSGRRSLHGMPLALLCGAWLVGRVAFLLPGLSPIWRMALDVLWLPLVGVGLTPVLWAAGPRNRVFLLLIAVFVGLNVIVHLDGLGVMPGRGRAALYMAAFVVVIIVALLAGRVVPFFISKGIGASDQRRPPKALDWAAVLGLVPVAVFAGLNRGGIPAAVVTFAVVALHGWRLAVWFRPPVLRKPMLLILIMGYAWLVIGLLCIGLSLLGLVPSWLALHALTAGAMGVMIYGMVSRVALGHTGRPITADAWLIAGFIAINAAALVRVIVPLAMPSLYVPALVWAAALWSFAQGLLFVRLVPLLVRPRLAEAKA